jgi:hypothetical protein
MPLNDTPSLRASFWSMVDTSGECWLWTGAQTGSGYGYFRNSHAHRVAWQLVNGPIPDGLLVCHNCPGGDNPLCVRPDHMFLGTQLDNMRDMRQKGRGAEGDRHGMRLHPELVRRGEAHHFARVTREQVRAIRARYAAGGITHQRLADEYGLKRQSVSDILTGRNWRED